MDSVRFDNSATPTVTLPQRHDGSKSIEDRKRRKNRPKHGSDSSLTSSQKRRAHLRHGMLVARTICAINRRLALIGATLIVSTINFALSLHLVPMLKTALVEKNTESVARWVETT